MAILLKRTHCRQPTDTYSSSHPLLVGSIKSNIGHSQYPAGVAGVIKTVQSIQNGVVPATLHMDSLTPQVDWSSGTVEVVNRARQWPDHPDRPRGAGVSAFGISGTNAHVILEQAPTEFPAVAPNPPPLPVTPWLLSAKSVSALAEQAARLHLFVEQHAEVDRTLSLTHWSPAGRRSTTVPWWSEPTVTSC